MLKKLMQKYDEKFKKKHRVSPIIPKRIEEKQVVRDTKSQFKTGFETSMQKFTNPEAQNANLESSKKLDILNINATRSSKSPKSPKSRKDVSAKLPPKLKAEEEPPKSPEVTLYKSKKTKKMDLSKTISKRAAEGEVGIFDQVPPRAKTRSPLDKKATTSSTFYKLNFKKNDLTPQMSKAIHRDFSEGVRTPIVEYSSLVNPIINPNYSSDFSSFKLTKAKTKVMPVIPKLKHLSQQPRSKFKPHTKGSNITEESYTGSQTSNEPMKRHTQNQWHTLRQSIDHAQTLGSPDR